MKIEVIDPKLYPTAPLHMDGPFLPQDFQDQFSGGIGYQVNSHTDREIFRMIMDILDNPSARDSIEKFLGFPIYAYLDYDDEVILGMEELENYAKPAQTELGRLMGAEYNYVYYTDGFDIGYISRDDGDPERLSEMFKIPEDEIYDSAQITEANGGIEIIGCEISDKIVYNSMPPQLSQKGSANMGKLLEWLNDMHITEVEMVTFLDNGSGQVYASSM